MKKQIPNCITVFRIILVFTFIYVFWSNIENKMLICTIVFITSGISDVLDGFLARKYQLESDFGKFMDPVADKLMQITVAISIASIEKGLIWVPVFLVIKEVSMLCGAAKLFRNKNMVVKANWAGKLASVIYFLVFLIIMLFNHVINPLIKQFMCISFVLFSILAFLIYLDGYLKVNKKR